MKLSFRIAAFIFRVLFKIFIRREVKGKENIPTTGPVILVSNHLHLIDPPLLILSLLPRMSNFMAKEELFHSWFFGTLMKIAEAFPVRRGGTNQDREAAMQQAIQVLKKGLVMGIFPEGTRSRNAQLQRGYPGATIVALRTGAPLLPVAITGTERLKGMGWLRRPKVTVRFGHTFSLPIVDGELTEAKLKSLTTLVMKAIAALLPPEYRGEYKETGQSGN